MALTRRQELFCQAFLVEPVATTAYAKAYPNATPESVDANAYRLMEHDGVKSRIAELQAARSARVQVTQDDVLRELKRVAFVDPRRVMAWGPSGVTFRDSGELSEDDARCVVECSQTVTEGGGTIRVKMADKLTALTLLGKHLGMFVDRVLVDAETRVVVAEELADAGDANGPHIVAPEAT